MSDAVILFAHGARDPQWAQPLERLAAEVRASQPGVWVSPAYLEFMQPALGEAIAQAETAGATRVRVVPVFLAAGGHVKRDLPQMLAAAQAQHPGLRIELAPVLGEAEAVIAAMAGEVLGGLG
ncbi:CbiX/SirB N-terminal domain-containing protein [Niveibacterium sp. SC-1]|uniref:sirohydrochlorin chelatase n=1 Tax=Niveibacterium sp. SC-1 TaxID=3135646 RepID=UPI00311F0CF3